jgi:hypothetical protein
MRPTVHRLTAAITAACFLAAPLARAQQAPAPASGAPQPQIIYVQAPQQPQTAPSYSQHPNGEYTAPLQQQTQLVYVPQSVALSGPRVIKDYKEGDAIPPGYHPEVRARTGMIVGGAVTFGVLYLFSVLAAAISADTAKTECSFNSYGSTQTSCDSSNPAAALYIPVAGPFIQMTHAANSSSENVMLAIDGIAQAAGAAMFVYGITSPKTVLVRNDLGELRLTPMRMGKNGTGVGLTATF